MPKEQRRVIEAEEEIFGFMAQTHISDRNVSRLRSLAASPNQQISQLATPMLDIIVSAPQKSRKKGRKTTVLTMSMRDEISSQWHDAGVLHEDEETGEQLNPCD
jgi:hypothetical protein